jgi:hypothetical protein
LLDPPGSGNVRFKVALGNPHGAADADRCQCADGNLAGYRALRYGEAIGDGCDGEQLMHLSGTGRFMRQK